MQKLTTALLAAFLGLASLTAGTRAEAQAKKYLDADVVAAVAEFAALDPRHRTLVDAAAGVLIFPQVTKGGMALAAEYGEGALQMSGSTIGYYSLASASVGLTAGMATHSEIILFMTRKALDRFLASKGWVVGADADVALISKAATNDYVSYQAHKPIRVFIFGEEGLMADISLQGSKINKLDGRLR